MWEVTSHGKSQTIAFYNQNYGTIKIRKGNIRSQLVLAYPLILIYC